MNAKKTAHPLWNYLTTIVYVVMFVAILVSFDIMMRLGRLFSYRLFRWIEYQMNRAIHGNLRLFAGAKFFIHQDTTLPTNVPLLIISNHQSMYDVSLLDELLYAHEPRFISKKELGKFVPAVSFISRHNKTILIDRSDRAQSLRAMQSGAQVASAERAALCIFPEGTRAKDGAIKPFKQAGLLTLCKHMPDALLVPVTIDGTWELLRYNFWPVPFGVKIHITIGAPQKIAEDIPAQLQEIEQQIAAHLISRTDS